MKTSDGMRKHVFNDNVSQHKAILLTAAQHTAAPCGAMTHVCDGGPAGVQGHVESPGCRLAEIFVVDRKAYGVPVVLANIQGGLCAITSDRKRQNNYHLTHTWYDAN